MRILDGVRKDPVDAKARQGSANVPLGAPRLIDVFRHTWDLGLTAFGGPPVHFQILHARFVEREKWVDEQTYQELFAICQGLPGPASTKMLFCLALLRGGFVPAVVVFLLWCLPGAIGMYALSLGVQRIDSTLPGPVYALLSGLNAATVGIIALAAVQLAEKAIRDKISRILVIFGACAGLCYSALWYFPVLMLAGGVATAVWDGWLAQQVRRVKVAWRDRQRQRGSGSDEGGSADAQDVERVPVRHGTQGVEMVRLRRNDNTNTTGSAAAGGPSDPNNLNPPPPAHCHTVRVRVGAIILVIFFASFITIMTLRARLSTPPLPLSLFSNMYLAGTVIFGGGPVVIPLLRSYVVDPGWVSSRDFLIGLAIIQSFPGPNFNFAVFLGALAIQSTGSGSSDGGQGQASILGAILAAIGIFTPGLTLAVAMQSFWSVLRRQKAVLDFLRGVNATAVGLVFTAVYRLWEIGYLSPERGGSEGVSLAREPWWVVVAAVTYAESRWFGVPAAVAILGGAVLGVVWFGAVKP
ncbi:chromate transporter-domain-containing protein [Aspergillus stella-maris]|uniref:chromate transporter-domain-containing protein n=1 Tax=Aspergillus stella-maris TaxID=1810926 RepID=UPI003CCDD962